MEPVPQVVKTTTSLPTPNSNWRKKMPYFLLGILALIVLSEVIWGFKLFSTSPDPSTDQSSPIIESVIPQLIASTQKKSFKIGEVIPVQIKVVTAGKPTDSVDVIVKYDPSILEASSSGFFELGRIYPEYPVADIDRKQGLVQLSATTPVGQNGFSGIGTLVTFNFKAKVSGQTEVSLAFQKNSTYESNLVLSNTNQDILANVINTDFNITEAIAAEDKPQSRICNGFYQYCQLGDKTGKQFCQSGVTQNNICTFDPELTVSCSECQLQ
jgi:hypothetical protein